MFYFDQSSFVGYIGWAVGCVCVCETWHVCLLKKTTALCWVGETGVCKSEGNAKLAPLKTAGIEVTPALSVWAQEPKDTHTHTQEQQWNYFFMLCLQLFACLELSLQQSTHHVPPLTIIHHASVILRFLSFKLLQCDKIDLDLPPAHP